MTTLRFITIAFIDGTTTKYSFQLPDSKTARQVKLDTFFKDRFLILQGEGKLNVFPLESVKSIQLSSSEREFDGIRIPPHTIMGAKQLS